MKLIIGYAVYDYNERAYIKFTSWRGNSYTQNVEEAERFMSEESALEHLDRLGNDILFKIEKVFELK